MIDPIRAQEFVINTLVWRLFLICRLMQVSVWISSQYFPEGVLLPMLKFRFTTLKNIYHFSIAWMFSLSFQCSTRSRLPWRNFTVVRWLPVYDWADHDLCVSLGSTGEYLSSLCSLENRQDVRMTPSICNSAIPTLIQPTNFKWRRSSWENLWRHPVYCMLLGWSLHPHPGLIVLQQESGTLSSGCSCIQGLPSQSVKLDTPQHEYCSCTLSTDFPGL